MLENIHLRPIRDFSKEVKQSIRDNKWTKWSHPIGFLCSAYENTESHFSHPIFMLADKQIKEDYEKVKEALEIIQIYNSVNINILEKEVSC